jgi:hypothetical protein
MKHLSENRLFISRVRIESPMKIINEGTQYTYETKNEMWDVIVFDNGHIGYRKNCRFTQEIDDIHKGILNQFKIRNPSFV